MRTSVPVNLFNPGQVFACLGMLEAAEVLCGRAHGGFEDARFHLAAAGDTDPVGAVLAFLRDAEVRAVSPDPALTTDKWRVPTTVDASGAYPVAPPPSPATLVAEFRRGPDRIRIASWGDTTRCDPVKFWGGAGGYPGVALLRDACALARPRIAAFTGDPFALGAPMSSSFRFDWRRDYVPLDTGFSPNAHASMCPEGFPLVEILAAIGLSHARPRRLRPLRYRYGVLLRTDLRPALHRAALGATPLPFPSRTFRMHLGWPGRPGQARCITDVVEET